MSHNHDNKVSRRNFLNILGATTTLPLMQSPAQILIESILMGVAQKATAADSSVVPRRHLDIAFDGGPPRWMFDHFLVPYDTATFQANGHVATKFDGSSTVTSASYNTILRKGINVPYMWQFSVPKVGGGTRPMDDLLNNMTSIRGINIGNPDHAAAQALRYIPLGATQSIPALAADASSMPIPAINCGISQYKFLSAKSKSSVMIPVSGNMLNTLLAPFNRKTIAGFSLKRADMASALDSSVAILNNYANTMHPSATAISKSMDDAKNLLSVGFGDLTATWTTLLAKYTALTKAAMDPTKTYVGINDRPIVPDGTAKFAWDKGVPLTNSDLRTMITASSTMNGMAYQFAMAEFVLVNNLSSSISISPGGMGGLSVNGGAGGVSFDEHFTGMMISTYNHFFYNLAYSACLLELIDQLKAKNIFQETLITTRGEFTRCPHNDGSGSDHGYSAGNLTMYSGAFSGPLVLGNIYKNKALYSSNAVTGDTGTWGYGASVTQLGKQIDLGHIASTTAFLLRTASPITASSSLLGMSGSTIIPLIEKAKQVG